MIWKGFKTEQQISSFIKKTIILLQIEVVEITKGGGNSEQGRKDQVVGSRAITSTSCITDGNSFFQSWYSLSAMIQHNSGTVDSVIGEILHPIIYCWKVETSGIYFILIIHVKAFLFHIINVEWLWTAFTSSVSPVDHSSGWVINQLIKSKTFFALSLCIRVIFTFTTTLMAIGFFKFFFKILRDFHLNDPRCSCPWIGFWTGDTLEKLPLFVDCFIIWRPLIVMLPWARTSIGECETWW